MSFVYKTSALFIGDGHGATAKARHWERVALGDVAQVINGYPFPAERFNPEKGNPVIRIRDILSGHVGTFFDGNADDAPWVETGEIVVGMDGDFNSRPWPGRRAMLNQRVCKVAPNPSVYSRRLLAHVLPGYLKLINEKTSAITVKHLSSSTVKELPIPLPPRAEQDRIASKLDELLSRVDDGERSLERVRTLLERYRQSVLKAAMMGELTSDWREQHKGHFESGQALLKRILAARPDPYVGQDADTKMQMLAGNELPESWVWTSIGQLFEVWTGSTPSRKEPSYWGGDIPWVSSGEVAFCRIGSTRERITKLGYENSSVRLHPPGTVLLAMIGEGRTRGQAAILDIEACNNQNAAAIGIPATPIPPEYIYHLLEYRYESVRSIGQGGNQPALNAALVKGIPVPLPPLKEINEICRRIRQKLSLLTAVTSLTEAQAVDVSKFRKSVLHTAFTGRLVPQDPNDEPVSVLLERIAAKRAAESNPSPARTRAKKVRK